jgi:hypothetical protein
MKTRSVMTAGVLALFTMPYRQNSKILIASRSLRVFDLSLPSRFSVGNRPDSCSRRSILIGLSVRSRSPINNPFVSAQRGRPSHNLRAIDRDLVVNSRGVSVVVAQEPGCRRCSTANCWQTKVFCD